MDMALCTSRNFNLEVGYWNIIANGSAITVLYFQRTVVARAKRAML